MRLPRSADCSTWRLPARRSDFTCRGRRRVRAIDERERGLVSSRSVARTRCVRCRRHWAPPTARHLKNERSSWLGHIGAIEPARHAQSNLLSHAIRFSGRRSSGGLGNQRAPSRINFASGQLDAVPAGRAAGVDERSNVHFGIEPHHGQVSNRPTQPTTASLWGEHHCRDHNRDGGRRVNALRW